MAALVATALEDAEEDESRRDRGIQDAKEEQSWNHEREGCFCENLVAERAESWCCVVLSSSVCIDYERRQQCRPEGNSGLQLTNGADKTEQDNLGNGDAPERLVEV